MDRSLQVFLVGAQPPPVLGMSEINAALRERLERMGRTPRVIDLAAPSLGRAGWVRLARTMRVANGLQQFLRARTLPGDTFYMSVSGGLGQVYELAFLTLARMRRLQCFLHHHSYAYLERPSFVSRWLVAIAGSRTLHIALSPGMAALLSRVYPVASNVVSLSNAALLLGVSQGLVTPRDSLSTIGYLGNITAEKGVFDFLEIAAATERAGHASRAIIAGPCQDRETEQRVRSQVGQLRAARYVGPTYGDAKVAFFREIDVLLFPTRYVNEAEPLTIHEALMHGVPVIAFGRGAIPEILTRDCGLVVARQDDFVAAALTQLDTWRQAPEALQRASLAARDRFERLNHQAIAGLDRLLQRMTGG
jgi:glycosyltransferase involved in cell wall biosynthesis